MVEVAPCQIGVQEREVKYKIQTRNNIQNDSSAKMVVTFCGDPDLGVGQFNPITMSGGQWSPVTEECVIMWEGTSQNTEMPLNVLQL